MTAHPSPAVVEVLASRPEDHAGAVALALEHLERRAFSATWHVAGAVDDALLFRLAFGRHEACLAASSVHALPGEAELLRGRLTALHGAGVPDPDAAAAAEAAGRAGLSYVCVPGAPPPRSRDGGPVVLPMLPPADMASRPLAWLQAAQVAVGAALRGEGALRLVVAVEQLDRPDAFGVFAEALDLVEGLVAAGRFHVVTLADLAAAA